jgi:hypothetical protein
MTSLVPFLQLLSGLAWAIPSAMLVPGMYRTLRGTGDPIDAMRGPIFFVGLVQIGFSTRWLVWPHAVPHMEPAELSTWAGLYVLSIMCAIGLAIAHRVAERLR